MVATSTRRWHPRFGVSPQRVYADSLMPPDPPDRIIRQMWTVTTTGDLPDDHEERGHETPLDAWSDYHGRILELEIHGFARDSEDATQYGRRWVSNLLRGRERLTVTIERTTA